MESILLTNLDRTFHKQFVSAFYIRFLFYDTNSTSYEEFDLEKSLKREEFNLI